MELGTSIRNGTLWIFAGNVGQRGIEFIVGIVLARLLLPSDFGLLVTTQVFTGIAGFVAGGGMGQALIQAKDVSPKYFHVVFTLQLLICSLIYCFFYFIAPWFAIWLHNPIYTDLLRVSALYFLIRPFSNTASARLCRDMRFKIISIFGFIGFIVTSLLSVTFALHQFGVWSMIYSSLISTTLHTVVIIFVSQCYPKIVFDKEIAKKLGAYGLKFSINDIILYARAQIPNFLIGKFLGPTVVGLFNKGDSLSGYPVAMIAGSANQTVFRALSSQQDNLDHCKYIYLRTVTLLTVYTFPFYIGLFWLAEPFIVMVYGQKWLDAAIPLQILCISQLVACFGSAANAVMAAHGLLSIEIRLQTIALLFAIGGCWYGIQHNDLALIAFGLVPSALFLHFFLSYYALRQLKANFKDFFVAIKPAIVLNGSLAAVLGLSDYLLTVQSIVLPPEMYLLTLSSIGGLFYAICFLYLPIKSLETEAARWKKMLRL